MGHMVTVVGGKSKKQTIFCVEKVETFCVEGTNVEKNEKETEVRRQTKILKKINTKRLISTWVDYKKINHQLVF